MQNLKLGDIIRLSLKGNAMNINHIAQKLTEKLSKYDDFQGLYLYGSQVSGKPLANSDLDIVAVFDDILDYKKKFEIHSCALDIELENDIVLDFHPMALEELNLNYVYFDEVKKGLYYGAR